MQEIIREDGGSQFTLQALIKAVKRRLLLIVAITLLCTAVGGVFGAFIVDTRYTTTATIMVNVDSEGTLSQAQSLATALKSITDPENNDLYSEVWYKFNIDNPENKIASVQELKDSITVKVSSTLLYFTLVSTNPKADSILTLFMQHVKDFADTKDYDNPIKDEEGNYVLDENGEKQYAPKYPLYAEKVDIISIPFEPKDDSMTKVFKYMALFFIVGAFGSLCFVLLKVLLEDTYSDKASFENDFAIDVLATIEEVKIARADKSETAEEGV